MQGGVLMESEKPASIVAMLRIFVLPTTAKGGGVHVAGTKGHFLCFITAYAQGRKVTNGVR